MKKAEDIIKKILGNINPIPGQMPSKGQKVWLVGVKEAYYVSTEEDNKGSYWEEEKNGEKIAIGWASIHDKPK